MSRKYLLEQVDDVAVVQLYADSFESRPPHQKILIWHLYQAAIAGRDIYYDQRYQHALDMREVLEEILRHPEGIQPDVFDAIRRYTKLFWINSGPHNNLTARKFVPSCTPEEFIAAARTAERAGATFPYKDGEAFDGFFAFMRPLFFDHNVDTMVTNKTPAEGCDILADSANNLYDGVWSRDLVGFEEKYGLNSRLVKRDGRLQEEVYRLGGRYSQIIGRIVRHLRDAMPYAPPPMHKALDALVRFYISGEDADRVEYDIAWVADRDSPVDTINGFVENYMDARGVKGAWEALVFIVNHEKTSGLQALAAHAAWFEERMPYDDQWRRDDVVGVSARAIDVIVETGDSGPLTPIGINLPNDQRIRERYGSKSVTIANVNEAYEKSQLPSYRKEFCWSEDEVARAEKWGAIASEVTTGIHEVLGHGSGRVAERLEGQPQLVLKEQYSALEESRADLIALYFMPDPKIAELGLLPAEHQTEIVQAEYESYARNAVVQLRRVREGSQLEEDHMRNRQMIVNWLLAHTSAIEIRRRDHKTYYVMVDPVAFHDGVGRLLREVQRIKSEGDYDAARTLFEEYGIFFEPALRDEVVDRVDRIKLPSYTGFVQPRLQPVMGADGQITDVTISYPLDLEKQMLEYSGKVTA